MSSISHTRAVTPIKDTIHGEITTTLFEREIIDSRPFQQLHFILQNSISYSAYPNNKVSRFVHSLGVCHLSGRLFTSALSNCSSDTLQLFLKNTAAIIHQHYVVRQNEDTDRFYKQLILGWQSSIFGRSNFAHHPFLQDGGNLVLGNDQISPELPDAKNKEGMSQTNSYPAMFLIDTLWQVSRLAGLLHDVGHLPMSHSFEGGLIRTTDIILAHSTRTKGKNFEKFRLDLASKILRTGDTAFETFFEKKVCSMLGIKTGQKKAFKLFLTDIPLHEARTLAICASLKSPDQFKLENENSEVLQYRNLILDLALIVLFSSMRNENLVQGKNDQTKEELPSVLRFLKGIVASEIDADRLDYVKRDALTADPNFGHFDLENIISNAMLMRDENSAYRCAYFFQASSTIEQFFAQRRDGYKNLIYHRTSSRSEACLQEIISRSLFLSYEYPMSRIAKVLEDWGVIKIATGGQSLESIAQLDLSNFTEFDDTILRSCFIQLHKVCTQEETENDFSFKNKAVSAKSHLLILKCLLEIVLFRDFSHIVTPFKDKPLKVRIIEASGLDAGSTELNNLISKVIAHFMTSLVRNEIKENLQKRFAEKFNGNVVCLTQTIFPKYYDPKFLIGKGKKSDIIKCFDKNGKIFDAHQYSPLLKNMNRRMLSDFDFRVYFVSHKLKSANIDVKESCEDIINSIILDFVTKIRKGDTNKCPVQASSNHMFS